MNPGSRYVQLLQGAPSTNNGTVTGGLAHVLQQAMMGRAMGQERADQEAVQGRLAQALQAMQGTPENVITWNPKPDGTVSDPTVIPARPGDRNLAMRLLAGHPTTMPYAWDLATQQPETTDPWALYDIPQGYGPVDPNDPSKGVQPLLGYTPPQSAPKTITTAEGVFVLNADGTRGNYLGPAVSQGTNVTVNNPAAVDPQKTARDIYGDPGPGLVWQIDPATGQAIIGTNGAPIAIPYEGGQVWRDEQAAAAAADAAGADAERTAAEEAAAAAAAAEDQRVRSDLVASYVGTARQLAESALSTGFVGQQMGGVGGTDAYNLRASLLPLQAISTVENLNIMRQQSKTGAALGSVTEQEGQKLESLWGNIDPNQGKEQFLRALDAWQTAYYDTIHGRGNWSLDDAGNLTVGAPQTQSNGIPDGVTESEWNAMTPAERALWQN